MRVHRHPAAGPGRRPGWRELRARGIDAVALPLIDIAPAADPRAAAAGLARAADSCALVMFVSANAVQHFMRPRPPGARWPAQRAGRLHRAGHVGGAARGRRAEAALVEPARATVFDSEALWAAAARARLARPARARGARRGRARLAGRAACARRGAQVDFVAAYRRAAAAARRAAAGAAATRRWREPQQHLWLFSSSRGGGQPGAAGAGRRLVGQRRAWPRTRASSQPRGGWASARSRLVARRRGGAGRPRPREGRPIQSAASVTEPIAPTCRAQPRPAAAPAAGGTPAPRRRCMRCRAAGSPPARCCWPRCAPRPWCYAWNTQQRVKAPGAASSSSASRTAARRPPRRACWPSRPQETLARRRGQAGAAGGARGRGRAAAHAARRPDPVAVALARRERAGRRRSRRSAWRCSRRPSPAAPSRW